MRAVAFARDNRLLLSVRAGGHNIAGNAVCEGGLMIDLSPMKSVQVNPETCRAFVEPGTTLADMDHETQAFGLATPLGINSTTGVAGLTLGGGFGWLTRKYGLTIDSLVSAHVVSANAQRLRASETENAELFWGLRGGGGNFGIATLFEFRLHSVGPEVLSGLVVYPLAQAKTLLKRYREWVEEMPEELNIWAVLRKAPPLPFLPKEVHGQTILAFAVFYAGEVEAGKRAIEPLREFGQPLGQHIGPQPYTDWQRTFDPLLAPGARNYWKSHNFTELNDGAIDTMIEYAGTLPSPHCEIFLGLLSGQANRIPSGATAYPHRDARFVLNVHGRWESAAEDRSGLAWARDFFAATAPHATGGVYVNFLTQDETGRIAAAYGSNYEALLQLKKKYDPTNLFRLNHNFNPAKASITAKAA
jgi:FAD/FMN-containing dehydrogenase